MNWLVVTLRDATYTLIKIVGWSGEKSQTNRLWLLFLNYTHLNNKISKKNIVLKQCLFYPIAGPLYLSFGVICKFLKINTKYNNKHKLLNIYFLQRIK